MKKIYLLLLIFLLSGCSNGLRCMFTHPDDMSPRLFELCTAKAKNTKVVVRE